MSGSVHWLTYFFQRDKHHYGKWCWCQNRLCQINVSIVVNSDTFLFPYEIQTTNTNVSLKMADEVNGALWSNSSRENSQGSSQYIPSTGYCHDCPCANILLWHKYSLFLSLPSFFFPSPASKQALDELERSKTHTTDRGAARGAGTRSLVHLQ